MRLNLVASLLILPLVLSGCIRPSPITLASKPQFGRTAHYEPPAKARGLAFSRATMSRPAIYEAPALQAVAHAAPIVEEHAGGYTLDAGDRLRIVVFGQEGLSNTYTVDAAGMVNMPLIGAVQARGASAAGLSATITERLRKGFIREPHVAVEVEVYRPFFMLGEVAVPGPYPYLPDMTVENAIAVAGGYSPRAFKGPVELRRVVNGQPMKTKVGLTFKLRPGDTLHIPERWF